MSVSCGTAAARVPYGLGMAVHLTRIYTRTGDDGTTGLSDFSRVSKNDTRLVAYADCDETNAAIGVAVALGQPDQRILAVLSATTISRRTLTSATMNSMDALIG